MSGFDWAWQQLNANRKVRRAAWRPGRYIHLRPTTLETLSYYEFVGSAGERAPWTPTRCDMLEQDWEYHHEPS